MRPGVAPAVYSITNMSPLMGSCAIPMGLLKLALEEGPSAPPATPLPATVVVVPSIAMRRTFWPEKSAARRLPSESKAR